MHSFKFTSKLLWETDWCNYLPSNMTPNFSPSWSPSHSEVKQNKHSHDCIELNDNLVHLILFYSVCWHLDRVLQFIIPIEAQMILPWRNILPGHFILQLLLLQRGQSDQMSYCHSASAKRDLQQAGCLQTAQWLTPRGEVSRQAPEVPRRLSLAGVKSGFWQSVVCFQDHPS